MQDSSLRSMGLLPRKQDSTPSSPKVKREPFAFGEKSNMGTWGIYVGPLYIEKWHEKNG